jgi:uncharacterized protein YjiS (DUF1127 family)
MANWMHRVLRKGIDWLAERQQCRTIRELQRLDRRTLVDIGLDPAEVEYIARSLARGLRARGRRRALIAKSSVAIMTARPRVVAAATPCPLLSAFTRRAA